jgi:hypothetical protein
MSTPPSDVQIQCNPDQIPISGQWKCFPQGTWCLSGSMSQLHLSPTWALAGQELRTQSCRREWRQLSGRAGAWRREDSSLWVVCGSAQAGGRGRKCTMWQRAERTWQVGGRGQGGTATCHSTLRALPGILHSSDPLSPSLFLPSLLPDGSLRAVVLVAYAGRHWFWSSCRTECTDVEMGAQEVLRGNIKRNPAALRGSAACNSASQDAGWGMGWAEGSCHRKGMLFWLQAMLREAPGLLPW